MHQGLHFPGHEAVIDEEVLLHAELCIAAFKIAGAVVFDAMAEYQVLCAGGRSRGKRF